MCSAIQVGTSLRILQLWAQSKCYGHATGGGKPMQSALNPLSAKALRSVSLLPR